MPLAWWVGRRVRTGSFIQAATSGRVLAARAGGEKTCFSRWGQDDYRWSGRAGTQSGELGKMPNRFSGFSSPGHPVAGPATSCGEENLLCMRGDPYATENILIHEFAHTIHQIGLAQVDATFQNRPLLGAARRQHVAHRPSSLSQIADRGEAARRRSFGHQGRVFADFPAVGRARRFVMPKTCVPRTGPSRLLDDWNV